jgi:hypothetical protein
MKTGRSSKKKAAKRSSQLKPQNVGPRVAIDKRLAASEAPVGVSPQFWTALRERLHVDIECGKKYTTNVYNRVLVHDCDNKTIPEIVEMVTGLIEKGKNSASAVCSLSNGKCPDALLVDVEITRDVCQNRLWEIDAKWTFRCLVLV